MSELGGGRRGERGSVITVSALLFSGLLIMAATAVDLGNARQIGSQAQHAADAAALGAARKLIESDPVTAISVAQSLIDANEMNSSLATVSVPPLAGSRAADPDCVEVTVTDQVATGFAVIIGIDHLDVTARAVACGAAGATGYDGPAIFANTTTCNEKSMIFNGSTNDVIGGFHSNDEIDIPGSNNTFTETATFVSSSSVGGSGNTFPLGVPQSAPTAPIPVEFDITDYQPLGAKALEAAADPGASYYNAGSNKIDTGWLESNAGFNSGTGELQPGLYYTTSDIDLSGSFHVAGGGGVTFVAGGQITVSGSSQTLDPWDSTNLLLFSNYLKTSPVTNTDNCDSSAISIAGSDIAWTGFIYAPNGQAKLNGSGNASVGSVVAWTVEVSGSGLTIQRPASAASTGNPQLKLVE